jgi:hypothetical protein
MEDKKGTIHLKHDYDLEAIKIYWTTVEEEKSEDCFTRDKSRWIWYGWLYKPNNNGILFRLFPISAHHRDGLRRKIESMKSDLLANLVEDVFHGKQDCEYEDKLYWRAYKIATNILTGRNGSSLGFSVNLPKLELTSCLDHIKRRRIVLERETIDKLVEKPYIGIYDYE